MNDQVGENEGQSLFEGCGREGPIRAIFLSEFHHIAGPWIVAQYPPDIFSKQIFDSLSTYIIPKTHLQRLSMTVNALGNKIFGYPIQVQNEKYQRNAYYFNTCFVCDGWARTVQYEQALVKLAEFFQSLELETEYLSKLRDGHEEVEKMFQNVIQGLNSYQRECSMVFRDHLLKLNVVIATDCDPPPVYNHQVPVLITDSYPVEKWDLTTQQIIPYIDGFNHISKIAILADVDTNLVKTCIQNLLYYRVVKIISLFLYGNSYYTTPLLHTKLVIGDSSFTQECLSFVSRVEHSKTNLVDVVRFYSEMRRGITIKDLCTRFRTTLATPTSRSSLDKIESKFSDISLSSSIQSNTSSNPATPVKLNSSVTVSTKPWPYQMEFPSILNVIDERRLVLFGLTHGLIRKIEKTLLLQKRIRVPFGKKFSDKKSHEHLMRHREKFKSLYDMFDGTHDYDEICLAHDLTHSELNDVVPVDPYVLEICCSVRNS